jgi:hypothetical protein
MDRRMFTIIMAIILIGCFFLPYVSYMGMSVSGFDMVKAPGGSWEKYIPVLIPLSGLMLLIGAVNNGNYPLGRPLWAWLPLLTLLFWILVKPMIDGMKIGDVFKTVGEGYGIGLWITIGAALALAFYNPRARI